VTVMIMAGGRSAVWWAVLVVGLTAAVLVARLGPAITARSGRR